MPIPKILFRTTIDRETQQVVRDVVDGQQRLRAILTFAKNDLRLSPRSAEFSGLTYAELPNDIQDRFLTYKLTTEQLINASDDDVIEIFVRMNTYSVALNSQELRNAKFGGEFKSSVLETVGQLQSFWAMDVVNPRQRVRMADAQLVAEMYGMLLRGVTDGGQPRIESLYKEYDNKFPERARVEDQTLSICNFIARDLLAGMDLRHVVSGPNVLLLFAAIGHTKFGLPVGQLDDIDLIVPAGALKDLSQIRENLAYIESILDGETPSDPVWSAFWTASKSSTQRIAGRRVRFRAYLNALGVERL
jgi:hypothetical protein